DSAVTGTTRASLNVSLPQLAVVVNEIQFKPPTGEPEWVELFNASQQSISLDSWQFGDSRRRVVLDSVGVCLAAGEYALVLPPNADLPSGTPPGVPVWRTQGAWPGLSNAGDAVVLADPCGYVVDSVFYRPSWARGSGSLERLLATASSTDSANWRSSSDPAGATPGRLNTATPRDVDLALVAVHSRGARVGQTSRLSLRVANVGLSVVPAARVAVSCLDTGEELWNGTVTALAPGDTLDLEAAVEFSRPGWCTLLATVACEADSRSENNSAAFRLYVSFPFGAVTLNELYVAPLAGQAEWVEIANVSQWSVDLFGWALQDARGAAGMGTVRDSLVLPPGGFALLAGDSSALNPWELPSGALFTVVSPWPGFNDDVDAVRLVDPAGAAADSARYDAAWRVERGYSLEKLRPELPSARRQSWTRCTDPTGGTPGAPNSVFAYTMPKEAAFSVSPNPFSPDGDGHEDVAVFSLNFPAAQATVRLRVFDVLGRRVRELLASEPCGPHRLVVWDGRDDLGRPCRVGPYVALLEWRAESGVSGVERAVVVLAW
ncbi:MAG: lamin tail domain-containing protein, partial [Calditrichaeota bacterium]|nr:lamin tail domain-containing protein [Calditrichota bacterium]